MRFEGKHLTVQVFGQSHSEGIGVVVDGLPAGFPVDLRRLGAFLARRAPGQGAWTTARKEADAPEFLSGLWEGKTCGAPVCAVIRNGDTRSGDYAAFRDTPRPSHADYPALVKYGDSYDIRGGGPFSGRLTAPLCIAGGIALQMLEQRGVRIGAHITRIGGQADRRFDPLAVSGEDFGRILANGFPVLDPAAGEAMKAEIEAARAAGDSVGGVVEAAAAGLPAGIGGPLFEGLESKLSAALFAIPAVKGVSFGDGFLAAGMRGSAHNDGYGLRGDRVTVRSNHAGGLVGGMTTGAPLIFEVAFKPTPSIAQAQRSVNLREMKEAELVIRGRHDPCVVPRAVPVVEAVAAIVLLDEMLGGFPIGPS